MSTSFDELVRQAMDLASSTLDFSALGERWYQEEPSWDYRERIKDKLRHATSLLQMGTGNGDFLYSLEPLPLITCATVGHAPDVPIAKKRLEPLGVDVWAYSTDEELPFDDASFDFVINRHESFIAEEVYRILKPGGCLLTQQIGSRDNLALNYWLQDKPQGCYESWDLSLATALLEDAGFIVTQQLEEFPQTVFRDVGAVIYFLRARPWQITDFSPDQYRTKLLELHDEITQAGALTVNSHRFLLECYKPKQPEDLTD